MRILFMGTPGFAVAALSALVESGYDVVAAVTQSDKPSGRGYKLTPPAVKTYASGHGIPVYQPKTLRDEAFAELLARIDPDLIAVASFGKILPGNVIDYPEYGCINVHASLLPEYRGAAPIQRAIIDGKDYTGISIMKMDEGLDTGDVFLQRRIEILKTDDFGTLHDKLAAAGGEMLVEALGGIADGTLKAVPQSSFEAAPTYAQKISREECEIDFTASPDKISALVRGLSPSPLAVTRLPDGRLLKIISATVSENGPARLPGEVTSTSGGVITVACGDGRGRIEIEKLLPEGKGRMRAADFINGRKVSAGDLLG